MTILLLWMAIEALGFASVAMQGVSAAFVSRPRTPASPGYKGRDSCPTRCSISGPNPANWSAYHSLSQIRSCDNTIFYEFSLYDVVDDPQTLHRIHACTSFGSDWENLPSVKYEEREHLIHVPDVSYRLSWQHNVPSGPFPPAHPGALSGQVRRYFEKIQDAADKATVLFAQSAYSTVGLYIGKALHNGEMSQIALQSLDDNMNRTSGSSSVAMQLCEPGSDRDHILGVIVTSGSRFAPVQDALRGWSQAKCLDFRDAHNIHGPAVFTTTKESSTRPNYLKRDDCRTIQVVENDSCKTLAEKCGISGDDFTQHNPKGICSKLQLFQHVCCSPGSLPDFTPKANADGSCATYTVKTDDYCASIAAAHSITVKQLEERNQNTWAWSGCDRLFVGIVICLSEGTSPMPAPLANAICGPQVPNTMALPGANLSMLNPCPLNACCDVWGQCGVTDEFCINTSTGPPGTARKGTNGCISNCGTDIVQGDPAAIFRSIAYFEGSGLGRKCLFQDALQLDTENNTHLHFAFGTLTADYQVEFGNTLTEYEFHQFRRLTGPAKILSFGGWDFSTHPNTYNIFRQGVTAANRQTLASNIAKFIVEHELDGVDIDWEYPGEPDIVGIPAADPGDGDNYLLFLQTLKGLLPEKSVSIAAPASYWYLKGYPIAQISAVVDYIVFMTYDLHGQWDANNQYSQEGCPNGMCLRSNINLTETKTALAMITKAGVPASKVVVGVTSYGRSFGMADGSCFGEQCSYTGTPSRSDAKKGPCTDMAGYISDAEIKDIMVNLSRVTHTYVDKNSHTDILVYDGNQWVGWMSASIKAQRKDLYKSLNLGGTADWASDLEDYQDPPRRSRSWDDFILSVQSGGDFVVGTRNGTWTHLTCDDISVAGIRNFSAAERWAGMDCGNAWANVVDVWKNVDYRQGNFTESISATINSDQVLKCGMLGSRSNCGTTITCDTIKGYGTGPAAYEIVNSLFFQAYYDAITDAAAVSIGFALMDFENKFAPIPPKPDDTWISILVSMVGLGATAIAAPVFNSYIAQMPYFLAHEGMADTLKDTTFAFITAGASIASNMMAHHDSDNWTPAAQATFSNYMGRAVIGWKNETEQALRKLFNGDYESIKTLTSIISDGKLISGAVNHTAHISETPDLSNYDLEAIISKAFYSFAIPSIWSVSGVTPFILDGGYPCGKVDPAKDYLRDDTMNATGGCYQGKRYYLVYPEGIAETCWSGNCKNNMFSAPPGLDSLDGKVFGGITVSDLIIGSVRTYINNGNQNGAPVADPMSRESFEDLYNQDVTTPGYIRIPVCSPDMAFNAWHQKEGPSTGEPYYPCIKPHVGYCADSSFVGQTTEASPTVKDCQQIVASVIGTSGKWETENALGQQHQIVSFGTCALGVQARGKSGNVGFNVGAQDIVDIISDSIRDFAWQGLVGAAGDMSCRGTVKWQAVHWGLYHT